MNSESDKKFLKKFIFSIAFLTKSVPSQMISIKNTNSEHIFCSEYLASLIGEDVKELIGRTIWLSLYDDPCFEKIILDEDKEVIQKKKPQTVLKINKFKNGLTPYTSVKSPIINPETNNVVGILFQGFEIGILSLSTYFSKNISSKEDANWLNNIPLTKREKQVIFLFLANLSSEEIAEMIYKIEGKKISKSTVDSLFNDQLYEKFKVKSRSALYKVLRKIGYDQMIPKEILKSQSIILDSLKSY